MSKFRKIIAFCLVLVVMLSCSITGFAAELAGDDVVECSVTITLTDATGKYNGGAVKVLFEDVTGTASKTIELTKQNSWGTGTGVPLMLPAPTTYTITFEGVEDGYEIVDTSSKTSIVTKFAAYEGAVDLNWSIVKTNATADENVARPGSGSTSANDVEDTLNLSAQEAFQEFLNTVSFIQDDPSWSGSIYAHLDRYGEEGIYASTYSGWYVDYVQGGTAEEYFAMTLFEQFLWTETYTRLADGVGSGDYDLHYGSRDSFDTYIVGMAVPYMTGDNSEVVIEAYKKLMDWQYDYIVTQGHGVPYNFINDRSYIDEVGAAPEVPDSSSVSTEEAEEIEEVLNEILEEEGYEVEVKDKSSGIWDDVLEGIAKHAVSILIMIVLGVAFAILIYRRKSKNIEGD